MTIRMSWRDTRIKVVSDNDNDTSALAKEVKEKGYVALNPLLARRIWVINYVVDLNSKISRNQIELGKDYRHIWIPDRPTSVTSGPFIPRLFSSRYQTCSSIKQSSFVIRRFTFFRLPSEFTSMNNVVKLCLCSNFSTLLRNIFQQFRDSLHFPSQLRRGLSDGFPHLPLRRPELSNQTRKLWTYPRSNAGTHFSCISTLKLKFDFEYSPPWIFFIDDMNPFHFPRPIFGHDQN